MTWTRDDCPGHGGDFIGLVQILPDASQPPFWHRFRDLTPADPQETYPYPDAVQVGCTCGWRSERLDAPIDCAWSPPVVKTSEWFDRVGQKLWVAHARATVFRNATNAWVTG